ncbi:MAG: hypothetical protein AB9919_09680 [Geobacteraceae bacterium]
MAIEPIGGSEKITVMQDQLRNSYQAAIPQQQPGLTSQQAEDSVAVSLQRSSAVMGRLDSFMEEKNLLAKNIRSAVETLTKVGDVIGGMNETLAKIVKNYPPFPPDSSERKDLLMSYISLRKEILGMTFPPPPEPLYERNSTVWDKLGYSDKGGMASSVPGLSSTTPDAEVIAVSKVLGELGTAVTTARRELVSFVTE